MCLLNSRKLNWWWNSAMAGNARSYDWVVSICGIRSIKCEFTGWLSTSELLAGNCVTKMFARYWRDQRGVPFWGNLKNQLFCHFASTKFKSLLRFEPAHAFNFQFYFSASMYNGTHG